MDEDIITYREIQSLIASHLIYTGQISGQQYEWLKAGEVILVDNRDVPELIAKRLGAKLCCGGGDDNRIFEIVGG